MEQMKEIVLRKMKGILYCRGIKHFNSKEIVQEILSGQHSLE